MNVFDDKFKLKIEDVCKTSAIKKLMVFGSQARGDSENDSDVDLLVEFKETPGLIEFVGVKQKFEDIFGKKVDLVTKDGLSKYLAPYINSDTKVIYE